MRAIYLLITLVLFISTTCLSSTLACKVTSYKTNLKERSMLEGVKVILLTQAKGMTQLEKTYCEHSNSSSFVQITAVRANGTEDISSCENFRGLTLNEFKASNAISFNYTNDHDAPEESVTLTKNRTGFIGTLISTWDAIEELGLSCSWL